MDEFNQKLEVIEWILGHVQSLEIRDQMIVLSAVMDLGDLFEHIYSKYNGKIFYMNLGDEDDN